MLHLHKKAANAGVVRAAYCSALLSLWCIGAAQAQPPAPLNWAGTYLGAHGGYEWTSISSTVPTMGMPLLTPGTPASLLAVDVSLHPAMGTGGILGGQNFRWGLYGLLGWEADATWGHGSSSSFVSGTLVSASVDWSASMRGRFGYINGPWLYYGTAGLSWERVSVSFQGSLTGISTSLQTICTARDVDFPHECIRFGTTAVNSAFNASSGFDGSKVMFGPIVGGGIERLLNNHFTARIEYLAAFYQRTSFGTATVNTGYTDNFLCVCTISSQSFRDVSIIKTSQTVRFALTAKLP